MNKILAITIAFIAISIVVQVSVAATISVDPAYQEVLKGDTFMVDIYVEPEGSEVFSAQYELRFNNTVLNVLSQEEGPFLSQDGVNVNVLANKIDNTNGTIKYGETRVGEPETIGGVTNPAVLATITFQAVADYGTSELCFDVAKLSDPSINPLAVQTNNGTVKIVGPHIAIFDTYASEKPYSSVMGTHHGVIIPDQNITVNRIYTYPCPGTGGHSESVIIWNETIGESVEAQWTGYYNTNDYHNLSFNMEITLKQGMIYNYTIKTGSYPQIIHAPEFNTTGGKIRCTEFIDINGKRYTDCIPAFRLWLEEE